MNVLEGIKVLDLGRYIAGPLCAALLADFGADVIRVDRVGGGEDRFILPVTPDGEGAQFLQANRNKRSLTLDIDKPQGREVVRRLVEQADVVIANMPPRTLKKLGLDYESLAQIKPDIVLTASTAFGTEPDVRDRVGFDGVGQAVSGLIHLGGLPDQPMKPMAPVIDISTALACALGTVLALMERRTSGIGQEVGASLLQTGLNLTSSALIEESVLKLDRKASGNRAVHYGPSDLFRTQDGWIITQTIGSAMFKRWTTLVGRPELIDDPRFADDLLRGQHGELLGQWMNEWCADKSSAQALALLEDARIPAGPVRSPRQVLDAELQRDSKAFTKLRYPGIEDEVPVVAPPVWLSRTPSSLRRPPPTIGQHTDEVLAELGYDSAAIAVLRAGGIV